MHKDNCIYKHYTDYIAFSDLQLTSFKAPHSNYYIRRQLVISLNIKNLILFIQ